MSGRANRSGATTCLSVKVSKKNHFLFLVQKMTKFSSVCLDLVAVCSQTWIQQSESLNPELCCKASVTTSSHNTTNKVKWSVREINMNCGLTLSLCSHPQTGGPRPPSGRVGLGGEWHRHLSHVLVLPHMLPAGAIQSRPCQEGGAEQVGLEWTFTSC